MKRDIKFVFFGEVPSKLNKKWENDVLSILRYQLSLQIGKDSICLFPLDNPLDIQIVFRNTDNRIRKIDNQVSLILDVLKKARIIDGYRERIVRELRAVNDNSAAMASCSITISWENDENKRWLLPN